VKSVPVDSISLNKQTDTIAVGNSDTLSAAVAPTNGTFVWTSSDSSIASVDASGKVTGIKAGTATINASSLDGKKAASCSVTVTAPEPSIEYSSCFESAGWENTVKDGAESGIGGRPLDLKGLKINLKNAPAGASVAYKLYSNHGIIEANDGKELIYNGQASIYAFSVELKNMPGYSVEYEPYFSQTGWGYWMSDGAYIYAGRTPLPIEAIKIKLVKESQVPQPAPIASIQIPKTNYNITAGDSTRIDYSVSPSDYKNKISWTSSDPSIVSADDYGFIKGIKPGSATITATSLDDSSKKASCTVTVDAPILVNSVTLNKTNLTLGINNYEDLSATINPKNAHDNWVYWSSSDDSIASVTYDDSEASATYDGRITGKKAGTATITATSLDGKKASCIVTVLDKTILDSITSDKSDISLDIGFVNKLEYTTNPNIAPKSIKWSSSDKSIASVNDDGYVTGEKTGTAVITGTIAGKTVYYTVHVGTYKAPYLSFKNIYLWASISQALSAAGLTETQSSSLPLLEKVDAHGEYTDVPPTHSYDINDLSGIEQFTGIKNLNLSYNNISDITPLKSLTKLETLEIDRNPVTDISALKDLKNLKSLTLTYKHNDPITNMEILSTLPNLKELIILDGYVTDEDLQHLKSILPNCSIKVEYK
ncbi:Ig-like domain-containing protein, partial [Clostridium acetobutylicum]